MVLAAGETLSYGRLNHALALWTGLALVAGTLPIWLLMRTADILAGGPWRRHADRTRRAV